MPSISTQWKLRWYRGVGSLAESIKTCEPTNITIKSDTQKFGMMWSSCSPEMYLQMCETNRGLYEMITKFPYKPYFDVDVKDPEKLKDIFDNNRQDEHLQSVLKVITDHFVDADIAVSGSYNVDKISYHIVLNNYVIRNEDDKLNFKMFVTYHSAIFDKAVYGKTQAFKSINQTKPKDKRIQRILINDDCKKHMITCFIDNHSQPLPEFSDEIKELVLLDKTQNVYFDLSTLPKMKVNCTNKNMDLKNASAEEILQLLPYTDVFQYQHKIARYCYTNGITFEVYIHSWLGKGIPNIQITLSGRKLWDRLNIFPPVYLDNIMAIIAYYHPSLVRDVSYRNFMHTFDLPENIIQRIETIDQSTFAYESKWLVYNVGMGGGKTEQTISYLKQCETFVWITPNIALANNTSKRFADMEMDVKMYNEFTTREKQNGKLDECKQMIVCLNSLHYIKNTTRSVIVIDEIETLLGKFMGDFLEGNSQLKLKIWKTFIDLLTSANRVILLDAFITTKTINFIKNIDSDYINSTTIFKRLVEPQTRVVKFLSDFWATIHEACNKIKNGNKIFINYPLKNQSGCWPSMHQVFEYITDQTKMMGEMYNADVDDCIKSQLKDVNANWKDIRFIVTNNLISCGINYDHRDEADTFDCKYLFIASFNSARDIIQVSYRARYLSSGIINVCYLGKMNQVETWLNDTDRMQCPKYTSLYNDILVEKKAPIKRSFQLFCQKANYKMITDSKTIDKTLAKETEELIHSYGFAYTYDNIDNINHIESERIENKIFNQNATMEEKMCLRKYHFNLKYGYDAKEVIKEKINDKDVSYLSFIWDNRYMSVMDNIAMVLTNEDSLFIKIQKLNNLETIFPVDIKKTKLDATIIEMIFEYFTFKTIHRTSSHLKILKEIYNTFFSKFIITTSYDKGSRNVTYEVDKELYDLYTFGREHLRIITSCDSDEKSVDEDTRHSAIEI